MTALHQIARKQTGRGKRCPPKPAIESRRLIEPARASDLGKLFMVFANDTRLRLLHALVRSKEMCVNDLSAELGMKPQAVSNQLQRLAAKGTVSARRDGLRILYSIADPCVPALLDQGLCLLEDATARTGKSRRTKIALESGQRSRGSRAK
jgi:ArsR family transcriptional regulator, lead/cadmium/zinc/bismuth-responsive transcriptional repressor